MEINFVNLSAPEGGSTNDGIARELASVAYTLVEEVVGRIMELGRGALITKADVKAAYRNVPVQQRTGGYWGWSGKGRLTWMARCPLG